MIVADENVITTEVKGWAGLHLLHFHGSTCSQKVRLMLGELQCQWQSHPINLMRHQNATPWFLGINPRGVVPVLVHDGTVHVESNDIITYLDRHWAQPGASYFFDEADAYAQEAQMLLDLEDSLHLDLRLLSIVFGPLPLKNRRAIDDQEHNGSPDEKRLREVAWWREKLRDGVSTESVNEACARIESAFALLDQRLASRTWLMGERISIVDVSWFTTWQRVSAMNYPLSRHPHILSLFQRLSQRPAFQAELRQPAARMAKLVFGSLNLFNRMKGKRIDRCIPALP